LSAFKPIPPSGYVVLQVYPNVGKCRNCGADIYFAKCQRTSDGVVKPLPFNRSDNKFHLPECPAAPPKGKAIPSAFPRPSQDATTETRGLNAGKLIALRDALKRDLLLLDQVLQDSGGS